MLSGGASSVAATPKFGDARTILAGSSVGNKTAVQNHVVIEALLYDSIGLVDSLVLPYEVLILVTLWLFFA